MKLDYEVRLDKRKLQELERRHPGKANDVLRAAAFEGERIAKSSMGPGPSPSAPGEPPHVQTGALRAGIHAAPAGTLRWKVANSVDYGIYLEFGTRRMSARPFMGPMAEELRRMLPDLFRGFLA
jgi:hypothetical protein